MGDKLKTMTTAGGRIKCRRCQAISKRTGEQCKAPASKKGMKGNNKTLCRFHGGKSTGPRTFEGLKRCAAVKTSHGRETRKIRADRSRKLAELRWLADQINASGLFARGGAFEYSPRSGPRSENQLAMYKDALRLNNGRLQPKELLSGFLAAGSDTD